MSGGPAAVARVGVRARVGVVALAVLTLLAACRADSDPAPGPGDPGKDHQAASGCLAQQRCVWVKAPVANFVPQGLALGPKATAYLSGYHWKPRKGNRECVVVEINRHTGKVLSSTALLDCRHGGGAVLTRHGLWIAAFQKLWLLDPGALGTPAEVVRVWRVREPLTASTITATGSAVLISTFEKKKKRTARTYEFGFDQLLSPAAEILVADGTGPGLVPPLTARRSQPWVQGVTHTDEGLWLASSSTYCGALTAPSGRRVALVPGAEGLGFDRRGDLWVVSESGSAPYQRLSGRPRTPTLTRIEAAEIMRAGAPGCSWD